jgi:hypothetical protein
MKRHICAAAGALVLALAGAGTATATGLPVAGDSAPDLQSASLGDQSVGEQKNEADVTQEQGNGNVNVSPAIAIGGDASTSNEQGNGNTAVALVDQSNAVDQSQDVAQEQSATSGGEGCCSAPSRSAGQRVDGGDQSVGELKNEADVTQEQGNGNVNVSPAIAIGGDASTWNAQGNGNKAVAGVWQGNTATQWQDVRQTQRLVSDGCCAKPHPSSCEQYTSPKGGCGSPHPSPCEENRSSKSRCGGDSGQTGEQSVRGGDQSVGEQKNEADVPQEQGNDNVNVSPAIASGGGKSHDSCGPCSKGKDGGGDASASTWNAQGNGNKAVAGVWQGNTATQSQSTSQTQRLIDACEEVMRS